MRRSLQHLLWPQPPALPREPFSPHKNRALLTLCARVASWDMEDVSGFTNNYFIIVVHFLLMYNIHTRGWPDHMLYSSHLFIFCISDVLMSWDLLDSGGPAPPRVGWLLKTINSFHIQTNQSRAHIPTISPMRLSLGATVPLPWSPRARYQTTREEPTPWSPEIIPFSQSWACWPCLTGSFPWKPQSRLLPMVLPPS